MRRYLSRRTALKEARPLLGMRRYKELMDARRKNKQVIAVIDAIRNARNLPLLPRRQRLVCPRVSIHDLGCIAGGYIPNSYAEGPVTSFTNVSRET